MQSWVALKLLYKISKKSFQDCYLDLCLQTSVNSLTSIHLASYSQRLGVSPCASAFLSVKWDNDCPRACLSHVGNLTDYMSNSGEAAQPSSSL